MNKIRTLSVVAVVSVLALSACGSGHEASPPTKATAELTTDAVFNDADVAFAQGMIPHHEQAIEMADMALDPTVGASASIRDLAARIKAGQDPEITLMKSWLAAWNQPVNMDMGENHDMSAMDGMMSVTDMDSLGSKTGADFDKTWAEMMIRHHEGAIAMAQTAKAAASTPEVIAMADQVISAQQSEINELKALLGI